MSCNDEVFTLEPLDAVIISPQVGHSILALEEDVIAFTIHVGNEFYQQYDPDFGSYQFVVRSDESARHNQFFTTLRHHAAMMMLLMAKGESPVHRMWVEHHYLALAGDVFREFEPVKLVHENARPGDIKPATFDKIIAHIDEHYRQKLELEDIAKIGGYNVAYTSQFFKRQMGISFVDYVLRLRLRDATVQLTSSDEAIARIASSCGFANVALLNANDSSFVTGVTTDEDGKFNLLNVSKGLLKISRIGYNDQIINAKPNTPLSVILSSAITNLEGVEVALRRPITRIEGDALVTSIKGTILENVGNANDVLGHLPGIITTAKGIAVFELITTIICIDYL